MSEITGREAKLAVIDDVVQDYKVLIAYHANCIDGFMAMCVAKTAVRNELIVRSGYPLIETIAVNYGEKGLAELVDKAATVSWDHVYILDFSVPHAVLEKLASHTDLITILDHHKTAFDMYCGNGEAGSYPLKDDSYEDVSLMYGDTPVWIYLNNAESGASLTYSYFLGRQGKEAPLAIQYVRDHDLWLYEHGDDTKYFNKYLQNLGMSEAAYSVWASLLTVSDYFIEQVALKLGKYLQIEHDQYVESLVRGRTTCRIAGKEMYAVYLKPEEKRYASDVGHALSAIHQSRYGALITVREDRYEISLRSVGGADCTVIASKFGGGGHKGAAGFSVPLDSVNVLCASPIVIAAPTAKRES